MAIDLAAVMDAIGVRLSTIAGLRVFDFPTKSAQPPFAIVDLPEVIDYDLTMGRGSDRMEVKVHVGVADTVDRASRDVISEYAAASGAKSIKAVVEAGLTVGQSVRVTRCEFGVIPLASGTYLGATFTLDIAA